MIGKPIELVVIQGDFARDLARPGEVATIQIKRRPPAGERQRPIFGGS